MPPFLFNIIAAEAANVNMKKQFREGCIGYYLFQIILIYRISVNFLIILGTEGFKSLQARISVFLQCSRCTCLHTGVLGRCFTKIRWFESNHLKRCSQAVKGTRLGFLRFTKKQGRKSDASVQCKSEQQEPALQIFGYRQNQYFQSFRNTILS